MDAGGIVPEARIFTHLEGFAKGSYGAFSDWFRYQLIWVQGGWWVDTDLICLKPLIFTEAHVFATEYEDDMSVLSATCAFKSPPRAEYLRYCLDLCASKDPAAIQWSEIGPYLLHEAIDRFGLGSHRVPPFVFNPINFFDYKDVLRTDFDMTRLERSYTLHLWNQMWGVEATSLLEDAGPESLYGRLCARYP